MFNKIKGIFKKVDEEKQLLTGKKGGRKMIAVLVLLGLLIATGAYVSIGFRKAEKSGSAKIALVADKGDLNGVETGTGFILRSNRELSAATIKQELKFEPAVEFEVQAKRFPSFLSIKSFLANDQAATFGKEYVITPKDGLAEGVVYKVATATSTEMSFDHDYSWAFKVKESFGIKESLPSDESTGVPVNTGIEVVFNRLDVAKDAANFFEILPATKGRFEVGIDKLTFIPEGDLKEKTLYKIIIKKGYEAGEKGEVLAEDKAFAFETAAADAANAAPFLSWSTDYSEMTPDKEGFIEANGNATTSEVTAYKYAGSSDFLRDFYRYQERANLWAAYNQETFSPQAGLQETFKFKPELLKRDDNNNYGLIRLPGKLEAGLYLLKLTTGESSEYTFVRVSPLAYYYTEVNGDGLIWAYDFSNKRAFSGIKAYFIDKDRKERELGTTDEKGLVKFDSSTDKDENSGITLVFRGDGLSETVVPDAGRIFEKRKNFYQGYLNTDRYAYRLTDKVHFWGVVKGRSFDLRQKKVKVSLDGMIEKEVTVSPFDTIEGEMDFKGMPSGFHNLTVSYNDETITSSGIEVFSFEKPLYKIEVAPDKNFSVTGEPVKAKVKVSFFDGTPVRGMELYYSINWKASQEGTVKTDDKGEAALAYTPEYYFDETSDQYSDSWTTYPMSLRFTVRPALSEEGEIWGESYVNIYGPKIYLQSEETEKDSKIVFKAKLNDLNLATSSEDGIIGQPTANHPVKVKITKYFYEQIPDGEVYDPIEKVKTKKFRYELRKQLIKEADGSTDQKGEWSIAVDRKEVQTSGYLKAIFSAEDDSGKKVVSSSESYDYYPSSGNTALNFANIDIEQKTLTAYKLGNQVRLKPFLTGGQKPVDNRTLIIRFQEGLRGADLIDSEIYTDAFTDKHVPSMSYRAVKIMPNGFLESEIETVTFDEEEKRLAVDIKADKERYKPREDINLDISIKDKAGKGARSVANVAAVDEALFNITPWGYGGDILASLYADIYALPYSLSTRYVSDFKNGAEKGGCFVAGTTIAMGNGEQKNIEDIRVGDSIETFANDSSDTLAESIVQGVSSHEVGGYLLINGKLKVTPEHKIFLSGSWKLAGEAKVGDYLIDEQRRSEVIKEIKYVKDENVKVYNIIVGRYHTYFAEGYYVHNAEKGGGGDARNFFQDTPLYKQFESDGNGGIKASFKAPDNLTSWRVSVNAYGQSGFEAGNNHKLVPVGLPLFVDAAVAKQYLTGDEPEIKLRAFGTDYKSGQPVEFSLSSASLNINFATTTVASEISVPLGKLPLGKQKLIVSVKQGELKDVLEKNFTVFENYVRQYKTDSRLIGQESIDLKGTAGGFTDLLFVDDDKGKYYDGLLALNLGGSVRSDIQSAAYLAAKALNEHFYGGQEHFFADLDLNSFQNTNNAANVLTLFPYGAADFGLTAKLADAVPEKFDNSFVLDNLNSKLAQRNSGVEETSQILYCLAALGQPELPFINYLKANANTTLEAKIYLALALYKSGDAEGAREIYLNELLPQLKASNTAAHLEIGADNTKNIKATAVLGVLASYLEKPADGGTSKKIRSYLADNQPKDDSVALEQAMILRNGIAKETAVDASFSFRTASRNGTADLSKGQSFRLTLSEDELKTMAFSDIKGQPRVISYFEEYAAPSSLAKSDQVAVKRSYLVEGKEVAELKDGDLVLVRLDPSFLSGSPDDTYQLVDYLPSGLKPVIREYNLNLQSDSSCNPTWYPVKITDEAIYFNVGKWFEKTNSCQHRTVNYYARVAGKGGFRAQGAVIQSLDDPEIVNITEEKTIRIK